jgi:ParB family chromosome partitioning protein
MAMTAAQIEERTPAGPGEMLHLAAAEIRVTGNVRKAFDQAALEELAADIRIHGIIQPLVVRNGDDGYELIAGERRLRAAKLAGLETVPARVMEVTAAVAAEMQLVENLQRQDLSPIEEALGFRQLMDKAGLSQKELAAKIGKSQPYVANRLWLLRLPERLKEYVSASTLTPAHMNELHKLDAKPELMERVAQDVVRRQLNVKSTSEAVDSLIRQSGRPLYSDAGYSTTPKFDFKAECETTKCKLRAPAEAWDGKTHPFCLDPVCWENKQQVVEAAALEKRKADILADDPTLAAVLVVPGDDPEAAEGERLWDRDMREDCAAQRCPRMRLFLTPNGLPPQPVCLDPACYSKRCLEIAERLRAERLRTETQTRQAQEAAAAMWAAEPGPQRLRFLAVNTVRDIWMVAQWLPGFYARHQWPLPSDYSDTATGYAPKEALVKDFRRRLATIGDEAVLWEALLLTHLHSPSCAGRHHLGLKPAGKQEAPEE